MGKKPELKFSEIKQYLYTNSYPERFKGDRGGKANFKKQTANFVLQNGVLYRRVRSTNKNGTEFDTRVVIDLEERQNIIKACHDGLGSSIESHSIGGHIGRDKCISKIKERSWWPSIYDEVSEYIRTCEQCQKSNTSKFQKVAPALHPIPVPSEAWAQIGVDLCSLSKSQEGYSCIVVAVCYFTKWVEAEPMKSKTAEETTQFLYNLVCTHGCAKIQINDQGREFVNQVSDRLFQLTGVKQRITSAYHPQANGLVERNNRTIQGSLLKVLEEKHELWPRALSGALFAFRTSVHASTGFTPFFMMYGRNPVLPIDLLTSEKQESATNNFKVVTCEETDLGKIRERVDRMLNIKDTIFKQAETNISKSQCRQKRNYEQRHKMKSTFAVGQQVLLWNLRRADRKGDKCRRPWLGPYKVAVAHENGNYTLRHKGKDVKSKAHGSNLKPFNSRLYNSVAASPAESNPSSSMDKNIVARYATAASRMFNPVNYKWQTQASKVLQLPIVKHLRPRQNGLALKAPRILKKVSGDGNCYFRVISVAVTGNEDFHRQIRTKLVEYMKVPDITATLLPHIKNSSVADYLNKSGMERNGVWATDVEILATASLLETEIYVYGTWGENKAWQLFSPLTCYPECHVSKNAIYINHEADPGHYDFVSAI